METKRLAIAVIAFSLTVTACSAAAEDLAPPEVEPVPSPSQETEAAKTEEPTESVPPSGLEISPRGIPISGVGVVNTIYEGSVLLTKWVVTGIEVDPECTAEFSSPPENGHYVALSIDWETLPELAEDPLPEIWLGENWRVIAENGTTFSGSVDTFAAYSCLEEREGLPQFLGPGEKATGVLIFDVPTPSGILIRNSLVLENGREIPYP